VRRLVVISGAFLAAIGVAALIALGVSAYGPGHDSPLRSADAPPNGAPQPGDAPPPDKTQLVLQAPLTDEEIARAKRIALHDPVTSGLISGTDAKVVLVGLYTQFNVRVGAFVRIEQPPTDFEGVLPAQDLTAVDQASVARGYGVKLHRVTFVGVTQLIVFVDLNSNSVAGVGAEKATKVTGSADTPTSTTNPH